MNDFEGTRLQFKVMTWHNYFETMTTLEESIAIDNSVCMSSNIDEIVYTYICLMHTHRPQSKRYDQEPAGDM